MTKFVSVLLIIAAAATAAAQQSVVVGVVSDGPDDRLQPQQTIYINELLALTASEFGVEVRNYDGNWNQTSMLQAIDQAYADPDVDMVLVIGFVSNQLAALRESYPKPTFLPIILDSALFPTEPVDGTSGIMNLNYLNAYADFSEDLDMLARIVTYDKLALLIDENIASSIPKLRQTALESSIVRGVELVEVTHDGRDHDLVSRIPAGTDAVFVAGLPRMPSEAFDRLVESINSAGLPSYSFASVADVERGLLATNTEPRDIGRQSRLNALNMQAVMLGGRPEDQPIAFTRRQQLTINMATARRLGVSPSFNVLSDSILLNQDEQVGGAEYGLVEIARLALQENQDLQAETYGVQAGIDEVTRARSSLFPQVGAGASYTQRKESPSVTAGLFAEQSSDAVLTVDQLIYSDAATANLTIQKELQRSRMASLQEFQLDVVEAATTSYYTVLNARSQLRVLENNVSVTRANLELARNRVRLGTSTAADVYRWEAEVARARIGVLNARAVLNQSWETLNRILHRPQGTRVALREAGFNEPFIMTREEFDQLIQSPADYATFSRFYIDRAISQAPEIAQLNAQVTAKQRELTSQRRAYWLPEFSIGGRWTDNLSQSGVGSGSLAGSGLSDWSFGIQATLPLFSGGLRRANVSRAEWELRQIETLRTSTVERVEERIRIQLHATQAAYAQIDLAAAAAEASRKNFELVSDAYSRGTVTVIELLDAQDTSLNATAASAESLYNFLITIMALQRAVGGFDYMLSPEDRAALAAEFRERLTGPR